MSNHSDHMANHGEVPLPSPNPPSGDQATPVQGASTTAAVVPEATASDRSSTAATEEIRPRTDHELATREDPERASDDSGCLSRGRQRSSLRSNSPAEDSEDEAIRAELLLMLRLAETKAELDAVYQRIKVAAAAKSKKFESSKRDERSRSPDSKSAA